MLAFPPALERIAAVEFLRQQVDGSRPRLRRVYRLVNRPRRLSSLIVGAYALAFHGAPRYTGDIDILIRPTVENAQQALAADCRVRFPNQQFDAR